jgi:hypothetical protein
MTNDRSRFPLRTNHFLTPIPPIGESLSINSTNTKSLVSLQSPTTSSYPLNTNESVSVKSSKQTYTHSNPPRELQRNKRSSQNSLSRQRILSAPDEKSPRSRLNQPKSSSANESLTPRSYHDRNHQSIRRIDSTKREEQQKDSLNALIKEHKKSKVPKAVQKRRIVLLFPRSSSRQEHSISPISDNNQIQSTENPIVLTNHSSRIFPPLPSIPNSFHVPQPSDSLDNIEPDMADSLQLAAILAEMQLDNDSNPNEFSSNNQHTTLDSSKYEYVVTNPLDTTTFKLSPRTLKPDEELAARIRFSQYYRYEMRSSANAQIPPLMASIVTENNSTIGNGMDIGQTFTFKLNATDISKKQSSLDEDDSIESTMDNELVQLCYDATLKRFYDPDTGKYYELTSA